MAAIREELILYDKFTNTFTRYIQQAEQAAGVTGQAQKAVDRMTESQRQAANVSDGLTAKIRGLVGAYAGLRGIQSLLNLSDSLAASEARIDAMNDGLQTTDQLMEQIRASADRSRGSFTDTADMVAKLGTLAGSAFSSTQEIVAFAEQINKQMVLSGASTAGAQAAMLQLTQAMSSGLLRGEELNSILEQTPTIAQTIADSLGVSIGQMREMASEGQITAEVVKSAILGAADETNAAFEQMPMTWGQAMTQFKNLMLEAFEPVFDIVGQLAGWIGENMDTAVAVFYGLAAAVAVYTAAQWIATGAAKAFFTTLLANPMLLAIAVAIGVVVAAIAKWVNAVGGLRIAWAIVVDYVLYAWDTLKTGFMTGVYWVLNLWDQLRLGIMTAGVGIANFLGDMKVNVLTILQTMINGAIDLINKFIGVVNKIPGVNIEAIEHVTFATDAAVENEAAKQARNADLAAFESEVEANRANRDQELANMWADRDAEHAARQAEIEAMQAAASAAEEAANTPYEWDGSGVATDVAGISDDVGSIRKSVSATDEDLKSLVDIAERRYVNRINLTTLSPNIVVNGANTGNTQSDRQNLANTIRDILIEQTASGTVRSTARAF